MHQAGGPSSWEGGGWTIDWEVDFKQKRAQGPGAWGSVGPWIPGFAAAAFVMILDISHANYFKYRYMHSTGDQSMF